MIFRFLIAFFATISLTACLDNKQKSFETNSSASIIRKQDVYLGTIMHMENIMDMQEHNTRLTKIFKVECGGFFDEGENVYRFGDFLVNATQSKATISAIIDNISHYRIHYGDLIINNHFNINKIDRQKYEVLNNNNSLEKYSDIYFIREIKSDELLVLYYINNKLIKVENKVQC